MGISLVDIYIFLSLLWFDCKGLNIDSLVLFISAGSIYTENSAAQILRSPDEKQIAISLPQKTKGSVKLRLVKSSRAPGGEPRVQENSRTNQLLILCFFFS